VNIKLDENLPERIVSELQALGHDVDTVRSEHLAGRNDAEVWRAAQEANRFLITQDLDFSDVRRFTPGTHAGLLLVRLAQPGRNALVGPGGDTVRNRAGRSVARMPGGHNRQ
jgi:predicted nuclease of predicted toxin-antitoxin system